MHDENNVAYTEKEIYAINTNRARGATRIKCLQCSLVHTYM